MVTTIDEEKNKQDIINIMKSVLFVFGFLSFIICCAYCLMKRGIRERNQRVMRIEVSEV